MCRTWARRWSTSLASRARPAAAAPPRWLAALALQLGAVAGVEAHLEGLATLLPVTDGLTLLLHIRVCRRIASVAGFHEFAEFVAEDVGTVDSGLNSAVMARTGLQQLARYGRLLRSPAAVAHDVAATMLRRRPTFRL